MKLGEIFLVFSVPGQRKKERGKKREKKWLTSLPFEKTPPEQESQKS
jgi:hypothetical protein